MELLQGVVCSCWYSMLSASWFCSVISSNWGAGDGWLSGIVMLTRMCGCSVLRNGVDDGSCA